MAVELLLRYVHFISIFVLVSSLVAEHLLLRPSLSRRELIRIGKIDGIYGLAVVVLLGAGFTLWLGGYGKPEEFYSNNPIFITKLVLFSAVGLLSIYPTVFFMQKRKGDPDERIAIPQVMVWMIRLELLLIGIMPLLAGMMAKGIGLEA